MTPAASVATPALPASSFRFVDTPAGRRVLRVALATAAVSVLGGCALWSAMAPAAAASAPQAAVSAPTAPQAAPAGTVVEPAKAVPAPVVSTPVSVPTPPTAAELTPPSPLPVAAAPAGAAPAPKLQRPSAAVVPSAAGFYINVGLFAVPTNGSNAVHKLEAAGQPVFFEVIDAKKGPLTRVRVGPFARRADADAAAQKIHALKLDAVVFQRQ